MENKDKAAYVLAYQELPESGFCEILGLSQEEKKELLKLWKEKDQ